MPEDPHRNNLMFSRKTAFEIVKALKLKTHDGVDRFCLEFELDDVVLGRYISERVITESGV